MKVVILCPYPKGKAPSQRFRFEQYITFLEEKIDITQLSFIDEATWAILYKPGFIFKKTTGILKGFINRFLLLFTLKQYDFVFIHREASPIGPPIFEWIIAKVLNKKIIYDFDDAIWLPNTSKENKIAALIKYHSKVKLICKWSSKISCGNNYLANYASQYNKSVIVIPTTIDTSYHKPIVYLKNVSDPITIGWTGTHSTEKYLDQVVSILQEIESKHNIIFKVISNHNPKLPLNSFQYTAWNKETEIEDLNTFDIGIMPLEDDVWAKGKCGFKGLQYMSLSTPTVMSPVGVNNDIIQHGKNGFLAATADEWQNTIDKLITNKTLRNEIGKNGLLTIKNNYSVDSQKVAYLNLFS